VNSYKDKEKELESGMFSNENNRVVDHKRKADDMSADVKRDIWGEFEAVMMKGGGNRGEMYTTTKGMVDINTIN
jgi:exopolysaccharide biosynthesis predicted pyruvyltransferase EpsI